MEHDKMKRFGALACTAMLGSTLLFGGAAIAPAPTDQVADQQANAPVMLTQQAYAKSRKVYIAPYSGTKYHSTKYCRGLRRARSVQKITLKRAKALHYTKCKLC